MEIKDSRKIYKRIYITFISAHPWIARLSFHRKLTLVKWMLSDVERRFDRLISSGNFVFTIHRYAQVFYCHQRRC